MYVAPTQTHTAPLLHLSVCLCHRCTPPSRSCLCFLFVSGLVWFIHQRRLARPRVPPCRCLPQLVEVPAHLLGPPVSCHPRSGSQTTAWAHLPLGLAARCPWWTVCWWCRSSHERCVLLPRSSPLSCPWLHVFPLRVTIQCALESSFRNSLASVPPVPCRLSLVFHPDRGCEGLWWLLWVRPGARC